MKLNFRAIDFDKMIVEFGEKYTKEELKINRVPVQGYFRYPMQSQSPSRLRESLTVYRTDKFHEQPSYETMVKLVQLLSTQCETWMVDNPMELKQAGINRIQESLDRAKGQLMELAQQAAEKELEVLALEDKLNNALVS